MKGKDSEQEEFKVVEYENPYYMKDKGKLKKHKGYHWEYLKDYKK